MGERELLRRCNGLGRPLSPIPLMPGFQGARPLAGVPQRGFAAVRVAAPLRYFPPARSAAPGERSSGRPTIRDTPWSKPSGHRDRSARDVAETHPIAGARAHRTHGRLPGADQIAHCLVCRIRHPDCGQQSASVSVAAADPCDAPANAVSGVVKGDWVRRRTEQRCSSIGQRSDTGRSNPRGHREGNERTKDHAFHRKTPSAVGRDVRLLWGTVDLD